MAPAREGKRLVQAFLQPTQEVMKIEGKLSYHEGAQGWTKIIFKKEILDFCKELQDKQSEFGYELEYPVSEEAKKQALQEMQKNPDAWPFFLRFKKIQEEKS